MIRKVVSPLSWEGSVLDVPYTSSYLLVPVKWFRLVYFRSTYLKNFKVTPPLAKERLELAKVLEDLCFFSEKKKREKNTSLLVATVRHVSGRGIPGCPTNIHLRSCHIHPGVGLRMFSFSGPHGLQGIFFNHSFQWPFNSVGYLSFNNL